MHDTLTRCAFGKILIIYNQKYILPKAYRVYILSEFTGYLKQKKTIIFKSQNIFNLVVYIYYLRELYYIYIIRYL